MSRTFGSRSFGFELTFFRVGVEPELSSQSAWAAQSLYLAHVALTDDANSTFRYAERLNRGAFGAAGAARDSLHVWNGDWKAQLRGSELKLSAEHGELKLQLRLRPGKPLVLHGEQGFSRKAAGRGEASYYSSFTRLGGSGKLRLEEEEFVVRAAAWMDHEFTSSKLAQGTVGWEWFAVQLDTNEELMLYQLRGESGGISEFSSGTYVDGGGRARGTHQRPDRQRQGGR